MLLAASNLNTIQAIVLGAVEGITEFLPISSTGHLWVAEKLMGVGTTDATKAAADSYTIVIQFGAILAVILLYRERIWSMIRGVFGSDPAGRDVLVRLLIAFLPAAAVGAVAGSAIKEHLLSGWPIAAAWAIGGVAILLLLPKLDAARSSGWALEQMTPLTALWIGCAQALAMWPGTSRSLITILAAVLLGSSLAAAVEFSFLLGLATLGAATIFEAAKEGGTVVDTFGVGLPVLGIVVAAITAAASVKWMVTWLQRNGMAGFGWYRIGAGCLLAVLLIANVIP